MHGRVRGIKGQMGEHPFKTKDPPFGDSVENFRAVVGSGVCEENRNRHNGQGFQNGWNKKIVSSEHLGR